MCTKFYENKSSQLWGRAFFTKPLLCSQNQTKFFQCHHSSNRRGCGALFCNFRNSLYSSSDKWTGSCEFSEGSNILFVQWEGIKNDLGMWYWSRTSTGTALLLLKLSKILSSPSTNQLPCGSVNLRTPPLIFSKISAWPPSLGRSRQVEIPGTGRSWTKIRGRTERPQTTRRYHHHHPIDIV